MKATRKYEAENFACVIIIPKGIKPFWVAGSAMEYITNFLGKHKSSSCYYISEKSLYKSTWKKFAKLKKNFQDMGGHVFMFDDKARITWYAIVSLIDRIDNGDVNLYLQSGNRPATRNDLKKFIRENINLLDYKEKDVAKEAIEPELNFSGDFNTDDGSIVNILIKILDASSMRMESVKKILELLPQRGVNMTEKELFSVLKSEKVFKIYNEDQDDPIVTLS